MRKFLLALLAGVAVAGVAAGSVDAGHPQGGSNHEVAPVDILQVSGLFDNIVVAEIGDAIDRAVVTGSQALILQVDSRGAVVSDQVMAELLIRIAESPVAIAVWVGPSGARLYGAPAQILAVADVTGMAPGAKVGFIGAPVSQLHLPGEGLMSLQNTAVGLSAARDLEIFKQRIPDEGIAVIRNMFDALDGYEENGIVLDTTEETITDDGTVQRTTIATARFAKLGLIEQLFHTVASPPVAYLLLLIGLALLVFEFFTAGIGLGGVVGATCTFLSCYGLAAMPSRWWAIGLIVAAMIAFAIDVQVGIPRFWTGAGLVATVVGSLWLFEPITGTSLRPSWLPLITGIGGIALTFIVGMPSMTRSRFATPTIGREWMIGLEGEAVGSIDPDGVARIGESQWRARTNRATPLEAGAKLRVAAITGITLEVEPLEGAAKDYREGRHKAEAESPAD